MGSVSVLWSRPVAPVAVGSDPEVDWKLHEGYGAELHEDYAAELHEDYGAELHEDYGAELHEDYGAEGRPRPSVCPDSFFSAAATRRNYIQVPEKKVPDSDRELPLLGSCAW